MSDKTTIVTTNPLPQQTHTQMPTQNPNRNYVSPYSMFYSSNANRQSSPENNQLVPHVNTPHHAPQQIIQSHPPVTEQVSYPNYNILPTSLLPPQQNNNPYVSQANYYPSPYQQITPNGNYPANTIPNSSDLFQLNPQAIERRKLEFRYRRLCLEQPNILTSKERLKLKVSLFSQSAANVLYFIFFIFRFNSVYLQSLSGKEKLGKSLKFLGVFMLINIPFMKHQNHIITKNYNNKFHNLSFEEIDTIIKEHEKQNLKII